MISRRRFLFKTTSQAVATFMTANMAIYVVGSAFKSLDGSFVAGAKDTWIPDGSPCDGPHTGAADPPPPPTCTPGDVYIQFDAGSGSAINCTRYDCF